MRARLYARFAASFRKNPATIPSTKPELMSTASLSPLRPLIRNPRCSKSSFELQTPGRFDSFALLSGRLTATDAALDFPSPAGCRTHPRIAGFGALLPDDFERVALVLVEHVVN